MKHSVALQISQEAQQVEDGGERNARARVQKVLCALPLADDQAGQRSVRRTRFRAGRRDSRGSRSELCRVVENALVAVVQARDALEIAEVASAASAVQSTQELQRDFDFCRCDQRQLRAWH